jgi:hypothetical protein
LCWRLSLFLKPEVPKLTKPDQTVRPSVPMLMASGRTVDLCNLTAADVHFPDLVEALVKIPRFNGATAHLTYTVAQHACLAHDYAAEEFKRIALVNDFYKALTGEISGPGQDYMIALAENAQPVRDLLRLMKDELSGPIFDAAGVDAPKDQDAFRHEQEYLRHLGARLFATEVRDLMTLPPDASDLNLITPFPAVIKAWGADKARAELVKRLAQHGIDGRG